jgi:hypothetical protein
MFDTCSLVASLADLLRSVEFFANYVPPPDGGSVFTDQRPLFTRVLIGFRIQF